MKYLESVPFSFAYAKGEKVLRDPEKCDHTRKQWFYGRWVCADCGKKVD